MSIDFVTLYAAAQASIMHMRARGEVGCVLRLVRRRAGREFVKIVNIVHSSSSFNYAHACARRVVGYWPAGISLGLRSAQVVRCAPRRAGRVRSGPPGRVRWRAGGACAKIFFGGFVRAPARAGKIFF